MNTTDAPPARSGLRARPRRASVLIVALMLAAIISVSLVSYIKLCTNSLKLAQRTMFANTASNLVEAGLEEAVWSFNQMGAGVAVDTAWSGWTRDHTKLAAVIVRSGGTGYTSAPTVTLSGGGGSGATATVTVAGGRVTAISVTNGGSAYTSPPTVALSGGGGAGATASATVRSARRTLATFPLDQNATGSVKVYVAGYDGYDGNPLIVAQSTITPYDSGTPVIKIIQVTLRFNGPFVNGVVAKNGINWNGNPMADSWNSNPSNSLTGPWTAYTVAGARANTTVADLTGTVDLGANGVVNGTLSLGSAVAYGNTGTVNGTKNYNFSYQFSMPAYPTTASLDKYYNIGSAVPATLPRIGDLANTADGRYYYFVVAASFGSTTTVEAGKKVTIVGSGNSAVAGTITIPAPTVPIPTPASLFVYTDGSIMVTTGSNKTKYVNNAWAGALQLYTTTTADTTINGNENIRACIFAPNSAITGNGGGSSAAAGGFHGSFVGKTVTSNGHMNFHYDESLARIASAKPWSLTVWRELQTAAERAWYATQLGY